MPAGFGYTLTTAPSLRNRALALLSRREHSRQELLNKLSRFTTNSTDLEAVLDRLEQEGWLSDQRYAESIIRQKQEKYGPQRIAHALQVKGVASEVRKALLDELKAQDPEITLEAAYRLWQKKFRTLPPDPTEKNRQIQFLLRRGFDFTTIQQVLRRASDNLGAKDKT